MLRLIAFCTDKNCFIQSFQSHLLIHTFAYGRFIHTNYYVQYVKNTCELRINLRLYAYANGRMPSAKLQCKIIADINAFITRISSTAITNVFHPQLLSTHENFAYQ